MKLSNQQMIIGGIAAIALVAGAAVAASYVTRESLAPTPTPQARAYHAQPTQQVVVAQPQQPPCDDKNIVGTLGGGLAGGVVGNQIGGGKGKTLATVGGALGGAYLGNQYLPTRNVTCR
jgi:uncharacterized protein YcfJ